MPAKDYTKAAQVAHNRLLQDPQISEENKALFKEFVTFYHQSAARKSIVFEKLRWFFLYSSDFKKDMWDKTLFKGILSTLYAEKQGYFETFRNIIPMFAKRVNEDEPVKPVIDAFRVFPKAKTKRDLSPEDMITFENRDTLISHTHSLQMHAVIATQHDAGFRPSELTDLNYGDVVKISPPYVWFKIRKGKTGPREVWIFRAVPHFLKWYYLHPTKQKNDPLWVQENNTGGRIKRFEYGAMVKRVRELNQRKRAPILLNKPLDFYNFRHSACYQAKKDNIPPEEAAKKFGHSVDHFINTYGRLDRTDREDRLATAHNLCVPEKKKMESTQICKRCDHINLPQATMCDRCAYTLGETKETEVKELSLQLKRLKTQFSHMNSVMNTIASKNPKILDVLAKEYDN